MNSTNWLSTIPRVTPNTIDFSMANELNQSMNLTIHEIILLELFTKAKEQSDASKEILLSFQGLKRLTKLHQVKLGKAINRLIEKGLLMKKGKGYTLTSKGYSLKLNTNNSSNNTFPFKSLNSLTMQGYFPSLALTTNDLYDLQEELSGKWFSSLRFLGLSLNKDSITLEWQKEGKPFAAARLQVSLPNLILLETLTYSTFEGEEILESFKEKLNQTFEKIFHALPEYYESTTFLKDSLSPYSGA